MKVLLICSSCSTGVCENPEFPDVSEVCWQFKYNRNHVSYFTGWAGVSLESLTIRCWTFRIDPLVFLSFFTIVYLF